MSMECPHCKDKKTISSEEFIKAGFLKQCNKCQKYFRISFKIKLTIFRIFLIALILGIIGGLELVPPVFMGGVFVLLAIFLFNDVFLLSPAEKE